MTRSLPLPRPVAGLRLRRIPFVASPSPPFHGGEGEDLAGCSNVQGFNARRVFRGILTPVDRCGFIRQTMKSFREEVPGQKRKRHTHVGRFTFELSNFDLDGLFGEPIGQL